MTYLRQTITDTSPASASTAVGTVILNQVEDYDDIKLLLTVQGGTGGVLDVFVQAFDGTTWTDLVHLPQLADGAASVVRSVSLSRREASPATTSSVVVGQGATPTIAADTVVVGDFGQRLRFAFIAGVGTSAGAAQTLVVIGKPRRN